MLFCRLLSIDTWAASPESFLQADQKIRNMKKVAIMFLLIVSTAVSANDCNNSDCINIGSYNIKLFGSRSGPANSTMEIEHIADRIEQEADLDIVVLQEINVNSKKWWSRGLLSELEKRGYALSGAGKFGGMRNQHLVLLHRRSVLHVDEAYDLNTETEYASEDCVYGGVRPPTVARYEVKDSGQTFQVVGVHMKSQLSVSGNDECDDEIREYQASVIAEFVDKTSGDGDELVVAGDYNAEFEADELKALRTAGLETMIKTKCDTETENKNGCSYLGRYYECGDPDNMGEIWPASLIDHIAVSRNSKVAVWGSGQISQTDDLCTYLDTQSDHALVWASFRKE